MSEKQQIDNSLLTKVERGFCNHIISGLNPVESYKKLFNTVGKSDELVEQSAKFLSKRRNVRLYLIENQDKRVENITYNKEKSVENFDKQIETLEILKMELEDIEDPEVRSKAINDVIKTIIKIEELKGKLYSLYVIKSENTSIIKLGEGFNKFKSRALKNADKVNKTIDSETFEVIE